MAFTNTVDTVGDAALTRSIIDRSITELNCNITTSIRQYAFRACAALASVNFPSATSVALGAFWQCTALTKAEFSSAVAFANNAFYGCSALTAVILRSTDQLCTITGTPFAASAIASGTGYIYVPAALVDQYMASWTAYAEQIRAIEDYPAICDPYSWTAVAIAIADGTYKDVYKVGDLVPLDMGTEGQINMQIAAFDADDLADGSGKAPISWISKELLNTSKRWNPALVTNDDGTYQEGTGAIGGWEKSELRAYYNDTLLPLVPSDVAAMIKPVTKTQTAYDTAGTEFTQSIEETVWLPGVECFSSGIYAGLFPTDSARLKMKAGASAADLWWLREAGAIGGALHVSRTGSGYSTGITNSYALPLCFCT